MFTTDRQIFHKIVKRLFGSVWSATKRWNEMYKKTYINNLKLEMSKWTYVCISIYDAATIFFLVLPLIILRLLDFSHTLASLLLSFVFVWRFSRRSFCRRRRFFFSILNILWTTHKFDREQQQYELQQAQNVVCIYVRIAIATSTFHYAVRIMGRTKKCYAIRFRTHFWPSSSKKKIWKRTIIYVVAGL